MRFFGKKNDQDENKINARFSAYSQTPREQKAAAIAVTVMSLLLTLILCFLVFFSSRWIYRSLTNKNNGQSKNTNQTDSNKQTNEDENAVNEQTEEQENGDIAQTPAPSGALTPTTPAAGPIIPNTGPESDE